MTWFYKKPEPLAYCQECGVCYKKEEYGECREYCQTHRQPRIDRLIRMRTVIGWAKDNWEKLEPQMLKETEAQRMAYYEAQLGGYRNQSQQCASPERRE